MGLKGFTTEQLAAIHTVRIIYNRDLEEYCCRAYNVAGERLPSADYFTDDKEDAKGTARFMVGKG